MKLTTLFSLFFVLGFNLHLDSQSCDFMTDWSMTNHEPTNFSKQHGMFFLDEQIGYTVGVAGTMKVTRNGGDTWGVLHSVEESGTRALLSSVYYINEQIGFVAGQNEYYPFDNISTDAVFMKTEDAGLTWDKTYVEGYRSIHDIRFYNADQGYAIARHNDNETHFLQTEDGGKTWIEVDVSISDLNSNKFIKAGANEYVHATGEQGDVLLLRITGFNDPIQTFTSPSEFQNSHYFINELVGFAGTAFKTTDGGLTWQDVQLPTESYSLIHFIDENSGVILKPTYESEVGGGEVIFILNGVEAYETIDGGLTWSLSNANIDCAVDRQLNYSPRNGLIYFHASLNEGKIVYKGTLSTDSYDIKNLVFWPNPTSGSVFIENDVEENSTIQLLSITGSLISESAYTNQLQIDALASGMYVVRILDSQKQVRYIGKIIKA